MTPLICLTALLALLIVARTVYTVAKDATTTRLALAQHDTRAASDMGAAIAALEHASARIAPPETLIGRPITILTVPPAEQTIHGVLVDELPDRLGLVDAHYITVHGKTAIPGQRAWVPRAHIALIQEHRPTVSEA